MVSVLNYYDIKKVEYADPIYKDFILISLRGENPPYFMLDRKTGFYSDLKHDITLSRDRLYSFKYTINAFIQNQQNNIIYEPSVPVLRESDNPSTFVPFDNFDLGGGRRFFFLKKNPQTQRRLDLRLKAGSKSSRAAAGGEDGKAAAGGEDGEAEAVGEDGKAAAGGEDGKAAAGGEDGKAEAGGEDGAAGGAEMPKICFGTAQGLLDKTLPLALANGYTHIDGAEVYNNHRIVRESIRLKQRRSLWITWKDNTITVEKIQDILIKLQCGYIDLFLIHFGCGVAQDYDELKKAQKAGFIRYYGVSNCKDFNTILALKREHNIFANQIQARPPGGSIQGRDGLKDTFIEECNAIGVSVMLYGTISGILNSMDLFQEENYRYWIENNNLENINKYYIDKYIRSKPNVIMVSSMSLSGESLRKNIFDVNKSIEGPLLTAEKFNEIERKLLQINFAKM